MKWLPFFLFPCLLQGGNPEELRASAKEFYAASLYKEALAAINQLPYAMQKKERLLLASALIKENRYLEAEKWLAPAPHSEDEAELLLTLLQEVHRFNEAKDFLIQLEKEPLFNKAFIDEKRAHFLTEEANWKEEEKTLTLTNLLEAGKIKEAELILPTLQKNGLLLSAIIDCQKGLFDQAEEKLLTLPEDDAALFWLAEVKERRGDPPSEIQNIRSILISHPKGPFHGETLFKFYTWQDYLQGEKRALKHLRTFLKEYPENPYSIVAAYLLGLDMGRERYDLKGKKIHPESKEDSLSFFEQSEKLFESLSSKGPLDPYFSEVAKAALLEKTRLQLAIAKEAPPSKKELFLSYAEKSLQKIEEGPLRIPLQIELYEVKGEPEKAIALLLQKQALIGTPLFNKKAAELYFKVGNLEKSLVHLKKVQKERLSEEDKLRYYLLESEIYQQLNNIPLAILALSKAIHTENGSPERFKAMYLRGLLYEKLERFDIALKQYDLLLEKEGPYFHEASARKAEIRLKFLP